MTLEEFKADYNWQCAFHEAVYGCYSYDAADSNDPATNPIMGVTEVIASSEGERDERSWIAVVKMMDGRYAVVDAGCDYTGWD